MEIIKRGKTPDGCDITIQDWQYSDDSPLKRYTITAYTPSKKHDPRPFSPTIGETYAWMFVADGLAHAEKIMEEIEQGTPLSKFKNLYYGKPEYRDFF